MDPLTQGVVGVVASQQASKRSHIVAASLLGFLSAMTPDLDVFIRSDVDPLLALEYHRQFTHSLFFIPVGGLLCAAVAYFVWFRWRVSSLGFKQIYLYCTLGYATHGLLDACTTYGTLLFWPFSNMRIAWNTISIIDPLFTLPLLVLIISAVIKKQRLFSCLALVWLCVYSALGVIQRERAEAMGWAVAESRGHEVISLEAKPSFANIIVWKVVYVTQTRYHVDAIRVFTKASLIPGDSVEKLDIEKSFPWLDPDSQQAKDIERFRWFSNGYVALSPYYPNRIIDMRYSLIPNEIRGMWGIELDEYADADAHVIYLHDPKRNEATFQQLWNMVKGVY